MTEHPPIPEKAREAVFAGIAALEAVVPILWREWTRGKAVVSLPAPDGGHESPLWIVDDHTTVEAEDAVHHGPSVWINDRAFEPGVARRLAAALLAAADRANQLGAKDTGEVPE